VKSALILVAAFATGWAAISWALNFDGDFKGAAVVAILCLGGKELLDYRESGAQEQRYRWAAGREAVWERRELELLPEVES
jgi:hypothetical protein